MKNPISTLRTEDQEPSADGVCRRLLSNVRGNVFAEYVIVLGVVSLVLGLALFALGVPLLGSYHLARLLVLMPFP